MKQSYLAKALTIIRLLLGILFLISGVGKLISGSEARYLVELLATEFYWLIEYAHFIVIMTSIIELILAILLFWNKLLKWALAGTLAMLSGFSSVLLYFYLQGMSVENCGCFGAFGFASGLEFTLIRNSILILLTTIAFVLAIKMKPLQTNEHTF
jgi:hypothetical protein